MTFYLLLLIPLGAIVAVALLSRRSARPDTDPRLTAPPPDAVGIDRFTGPPFDVTSRRWVSDERRVRHRDHDAELFTFHHEYEIGRMTKEASYAVAALALPRVCPQLSVTRPTLRGTENIELESEAFNDAFEINTDDRKFAYDVLSPTVMEWLLADERARRMPVRMGGALLFTVRTGTADDAADRALLDFLCDFYDRVPPFVWRPQPNGGPT
jgi:uncharacterized protein DUF3137